MRGENQRHNQSVSLVEIQFNLYVRYRQAFFLEKTVYCLCDKKFLIVYIRFID